MSEFDVKGKVALITGAGSGINLALAQRLLEAGCSVMIADLALRPEASALVSRFPHPAPAKTDASSPSAVFQRTDVADWAQLQSVFDATLAHFGRVDIVVNGAGIYEPPSSTFWNPPGISPLSRDAADASPGTYKLFAVNTMGPIRLAQIAIDYWTRNRETLPEGGNLLWVASMGAYIHTIQTPLYLASKAAVVSVVKALQGIRKLFNIRNSAICPAGVRTPLFDQEYCKDQLGPDDTALTANHVAAAMMELLTEKQYGDGNVVEIMNVGTNAEPDVRRREVPLEALYPTVSPVGAGTKYIEEETKFMERVAEKGMRTSCE